MLVGRTITHCYVSPVHKSVLWRFFYFLMNLLALLHSFCHLLAYLLPLGLSLFLLPLFVLTM